MGFSKGLKSEFETAVVSEPIEVILLLFVIVVPLNTQNTPHIAVMSYPGNRHCRDVCCIQHTSRQCRVVNNTHRGNVVLYTIHIASMSYSGTRHCRGVCCILRVDVVQFCLFDLIRRTLPPTFNDTAITHHHCDTT